jgi:hypothetical protein
MSLKPSGHGIIAIKSDISPALNLILSFSTLVAQYPTTSKPYYLIDHFNKVYGLRVSVVIGY